MSSNLRDFISARRAEISEQMQLLRVELSELDRAESALTGTRPSEAPPAKRDRVTGILTIKDAIVDVLNDVPGADALGILQLIERKHGMKIERTSLSPQLSRLKHEGKIVLERKVWGLAPGSKMQLMLE